LEAGTLDTIGEAQLADGDTDAALVEFAAALRLSREIGDRWLEWEVLLHIGNTHLHRDAHAAALEHFTEALEVCREVEDRHGEATVLNLLGRAHLLADQLDEAGMVLEQALTVRALVPDGFEEAHLYRDLGDLARAKGRPDAARAHWERATRLYQQANATAETAEMVARLH
jgi:tetratricopeptide (TPR) repeat protein